ncbi:MAG: hypothetical protein Q4F97_00070 [Bacteroidales bacterium]|nr:hypothetical protein [Bacteroidales bacterium]
MENLSPVLNQKYHFSFNGVEYDITYLENNMMESICTVADLNHHPSRINQMKVLKISSFRICENDICYFWSTPKVSMVYIVNWKEMSVNAIMTNQDMIQIRESGTITIAENKKDN